MKSPVSLCLIVKNEPQLEKCLLSIKDYVSEIVIVDTGSTDGTAEIAKKYATIFEVYTECNNPETGLIEDFSQARNRSFELATQPWIMWCDGDDIIDGGEHLSQLIEEFEINRSLRKVDAVAYLFPYEYAYNENSQCILRHYRERLFSNKNYFKWVNPVHEVVIPNDNLNIPMVPKDEIVFKHQRQFSDKVHEPGRNLRILEKYYQEVGDSDPRQLYYLGLEYCNSGMVDKGIESLKKYIDISGWEDERVMACLKLVDIYYNLAQYENGLPWAFKSIEIKEDWCEGYLALSKLFYFIALRGGPYEIRNWQRCAFFAKRGLELPPTRTLLFINPLDRDYFSHIYLNFALNKLGDVSGALESAATGLKSQPNDKALITNKKLYENFLSRDKIVKEVNTLLSNEAIDKNTLQAITALINNQPPTTLGLLAHKNNSSFEEEIPLKIKKSDNPLRIVFVLGDGVEEWTPETVKKTGIGGSELMAMEMSKRLAALGHKVSIYNSCGQFNEGIYDGVTYYQSHKFHDLECDVLVVSRQAQHLLNKSIKCKLKLLWVHDVYAVNATNEALLQADRILALTNWHKDLLVQYHNIHPSQVIVTRNGIDLNRFNQKVDRNRFKCVNSSSPDRSWPVIFQMWPEIKKRVPQAELHLYYGFKNWEYGAQFDPKQKDLINLLKSQIEAMKQLGVVFHDRVSQQELAKELLSAGVWTFSTWFSETSCISAMEMQAAGVRMVTSNIAALKETVADRGILIDGDWTSPEYQKQFIEATVEKLTNTDDSDRQLLQEYAKQNFDLNSLAENWESMFYSLIEEFKTNPIIPYFPTPAYRTESSYIEEKFTIVKQEQVYDPTISGQKVKLNIGAGPNIFPYDGWINYDKAFFNEYFAQLSSIATEIRQFGIDNISDNAKSWIASATTIQKQIIIYLTQNKEIQFRFCDVNEPFPQHPDNSVDIIYLGQMIEHLNPIYTIPNFLKECYRMLKPGGIIRLATPDLDLLINAYRDGTLDKFANEQPEFYKNTDPASQLSYIMFGACGPHCTWDNYEGHMFLFNKNSMTTALNKAGFKNIEFFDQDTISHNEIIKHEVTDEGWSHSLVAEGTK